MSVLAILTMVCGIASAHNHETAHTMTVGHNGHSHQRKSRVQAMVCGPLTIPNSNTTNVDGDTGATYNVRCNKGYSHNAATTVSPTKVQYEDGTFPVSCTVNGNGQPTWMETETCAAMACGSLKIPDSDTPYVDGNIGATYNVNCNEGYRHNGATSGAFEVECKENGAGMLTWDGTQTCEDIIECNNVNCGNHASCTEPNVNSYTCTCNNGYSGNTEVNSAAKCEAKTCNPLEIANSVETIHGNTGDIRRVVCNHGYSHNGDTVIKVACEANGAETPTWSSTPTCADINECANVKCGRNAFCSDSTQDPKNVEVGSYQCTCNAGYAGAAVGETVPRNSAATCTACSSLEPSQGQGRFECPPGCQFSKLSHQCIEPPESSALMEQIDLESVNKATPKLMRSAEAP